MSTKQSFLYLSVLILFSACNPYKPTAITEKETKELLAKGDSIAINTQNILLHNIAAAIEKAGVDSAVAYCNIRAIPLTDSVAATAKIEIQRLSDKNRNPVNAIKLLDDSLAWKRLKSGEKALVNQDAEGNIFYYKGINIGTPLCLKCHGDKNDIKLSTQQVIAQKYPDDKAIDYKLKDLRGMWKIKLKDSPIEKPLK